MAGMPPVVLGAPMGGRAPPAVAIGVALGVEEAGEEECDPDEDMIGAMGSEGGIYMDLPTYFQLNQQAGVSDAEILAQLNSQMQNLG